LERITRVSMLFIIVLLISGLLHQAEAVAKPTEELLLGGHLRVKEETCDNLLDLSDDTGDPLLDDSYQFYRLRTRFWIRAAPRQRLELFFRLANEYRFGRNENTAGVRDPESKLSLDNAWAEVAFRRLRFKFGRMDLMYGEGFLIFDGTPADGSGSAWFDAMKLTLSTDLLDVDLLTAKIDEEGFGGTSKDEDLYGIYAKKDKVDLYILSRNKRMAIVDDSGVVVQPARRTTALGMRFAHLPKSGARLAAEGVYQTGEMEDEESSGLGGYCRIGWKSDRKLQSGIEIGGLFLSGDDQNTEENEGWDGFYSEWPKYSELYVYTMYDNTTRIEPYEPGTWTNLSAAWAEASLGPQKYRLKARITSFSAPERTGPGEGDARGLLLALRVDTVLGEGLKGQVVGEFFDPGDFYDDGADVAWYARWQITASF